ncbi:predicted protein [Uncinocarpus reesii 1704]|uniref:Uncharacterized protein n=1 Tax=Uncinocarpus reesii (strain UAMH 1704) TaxID=336963 RepID=C4JYL8_UNCRE|nr:uncharacterized protein UREG_07269 [Uncinocarpus reesii 1704]EEP82404.1 predicted protein [Uncinocarpus reesii 1704]
MEIPRSERDKADIRETRAGNGESQPSNSITQQNRVAENAEQPQATPARSVGTSEREPREMARQLRIVRETFGIHDNNLGDIATTGLPRGPLRVMNPDPSPVPSSGSSEVERHGNTLGPNVGVPQHSARPRANSQDAQNAAANRQYIQSALDAMERPPARHHGTRPPPPPPPPPQHHPNHPQRYGPHHPPPGPMHQARPPPAQPSRYRRPLNSPQYHQPLQAPQGFGDPAPVHPNFNESYHREPDYQQRPPVYTRVPPLPVPPMRPEDRERLLNPPRVQTNIPRYYAAPIRCQRIWTWMDNVEPGLPEEEVDEPPFHEEPFDDGL